MKTINLWKNTIVVVATLLGVLFPLLGKAGPMGVAGPMVDEGCTDLLLSSFLEAQGTSTQFFPPVQDYVGWTDGAFTTFALVDYAGLANKYIKAQPKSPSLGTEVGGSVKQCAADSEGRIQIKVNLFTTRALGFAQSIEALKKNKFDFLHTPTIFGANAQDVVNGAAAAVGPAHLSTTFFIEPGAGLPDLVDVLVNNPAKYAPVTLSFTSTTCGSYPDGSKAHLDVNQVASTVTSTNHKVQLIFSIETIAIVSGISNNCD